MNSSGGIPPTRVVASVGTCPGDTTLARIPLGASSIERVSVRLFIPAFAAPYAANRTAGRIPAMDEMPMIDDPGSITSAHALAAIKCGRRFRAIC